MLRMKACASFHRALAPLVPLVSLVSFCSRVDETLRPSRLQSFALMIGMNDILRMSPQKFRQAVTKAGGDVDAARSAIAAAIADGVRCIAAFALELAGARQPALRVLVCELLPVREADCESFGRAHALRINELAARVNRRLREEPLPAGCELLRWGSAWLPPRPDNYCSDGP